MYLFKTCSKSLPAYEASVWSASTHLGLNVATATLQPPTRLLATNTGFSACEPRLLNTF